MGRVFYEMKDSIDQQKEGSVTAATVAVSSPFANQIPQTEQCRLQTLLSAKFELPRNHEIRRKMLGIIIERQKSTHLDCSVPEQQRQILPSLAPRLPSQAAILLQQELLPSNLGCRY